MNIRDLQPGSYTVVKQGTGAPIKLNIRDLPKGSYTVVPPKQEGFLSKVGNFFGSIGQGISNLTGFGGYAKGIGGATAILEQPSISKRVEESGTKQQQLIQQAKALPMGDPRRTQLMQQAQQIAGGATQLAESSMKDLAQSPSALQMAGSTAKLGLTVATFGGVGTGGALGSQVLKGASIGAGLGFGEAAEKGKTGKELVAPTLVGGAISGALPLVFKGIEEGFNKVAPRLSRWLEEKNLRLTPTQKRDFKDKLNDVDEFLSKEKIIGTPETRYEKVSEIYNAKENQLQNFLDTELKGRSIAKDAYINSINNIKRQFANDRDRVAITKQIDDFISTIKDYWPRDIPANKLNILKRSTYNNAFNKAGTKVSDEVEYMIADRTKEAIEKIATGITGAKTIAGQTINQFNKAYGTIITARNLLKTAIGRPQLGVLMRFLAGATGSTLSQLVGGGAVGDILGFGLGEEAARVASTPFRAGLSAGLRTASELAQTPTVQTIGGVARRAASQVLPRAGQ